MKTFIEIAMQIKEKLGLFPMNEMSMAFHYKDRHVEVCAWVENPTPRDNRYFKYYNSEYITGATKVARIRMDKPEYVGGNHKEKNLKKWTLSDKEKQYLVKILNSMSDDPMNEGYTRWQEVIIRYNQDNFHIYPNDTKNGNLDKGTRNPALPEHVKPFPIDYPMPNYLELK